MITDETFAAIVQAEKIFDNKQFDSDFSFCQMDSCYSSGSYSSLSAEVTEITQQRKAFRRTPMNNRMIIKKKRISTTARHPLSTLVEQQPLI
ncbi:hypothetical protein T10_143 [Trichinella papuae]|uniref:Uncharacterized protein n=1 Tax=Trichinella papuae TaxID=268474 RepID=A0A0V1MD67_9BILA|nr:hypothetical protein T10_143 [Trichinella papuae]